MLEEKEAQLSHVFKVSGDKRITEQVIFMCPDIHWDNPKCERKLLKSHLDEAAELGARILMPGDTFCLMQGKFDPRGNKSGIRPEHNTDNYLGDVMKDAAKFFAPYQHLIDVIGWGNHETAVAKRQEFNFMEYFIDLLNKNSTGHKVHLGGYGGWYTVAFQSGQARKRYTIKYYHGSGGGAPVTKGTINHNRMIAETEGADCILMGHVHQDYEVSQTVEFLDQNYQQKVKRVLLVRCSTYKEEFKGQTRGFHVERGGGPRPLGGRFLHLKFDRGSGGGDGYVSPCIKAYTRPAL